MKKDITLLMYSHSSYSDVWGPFFKQAEKYTPEYKKALFSNDDVGKTPKNWSFIKYEDSCTYSCLEHIDTELCFLHHEDMFLYAMPNKELMAVYEDVVLNDNIDFIRLLRSVDNPSFNYKGISSLYPIPHYSQYFFSVQPSICKTESLKKIYKNTKINHIHDFELNVQQVCRNLDMKGLFHYNNEPKRGMYHYDSSVYPYVATAIVKGKWNMSDYTGELTGILRDSNIDISIRGEV
jgi:hypothetical protein